MCQPIAGQDPGRTAASRCSQSQAQDGHDNIGSDVAPAKRFFKVHWHNRSSFLLVDWHSDYHKNTCPYDCWMKSSTRACGSSARRRSWISNWEVVRVGHAPFSCWRRRLSALAWPWCTRPRASSPRRHFVSLRLLRHPWSLYIHLKWTFMCGFSLNPPCFELLVIFWLFCTMV